MEDLLTFLRAHAEGDVLPWEAEAETARRFDLSIAKVDRLALENGLLPGRYRRNRQMLSCTQQLQLLDSAVAVIGCGGLGGYVIEELARLGVGRIVAIDPDVFEEHNLNRQILSSPASLGVPKVVAAAERVATINPAVQLESRAVAFSEDNGCDLLAGANVVVDALDSIVVRLQLGRVCRQLSVPMVYGAIAGWYGHVATVLPGDETLERIYGADREGKGVEQSLGNPSFTPAVVASLQVAETCKLLLGIGKPLRHRPLAIDLFSMEFEEIVLEP